MIINTIVWLCFLLSLVCFGITPLLLFKIISNSIIFEKNLSKIIALLISLTTHFIFSIFTFLIALFFYVGPDPRPNQIVSVGSKIAIAILFLVYIFVEWIICSVLAGKKITPFFLISNNETPLSITD